MIGLVASARVAARAGEVDAGLEMLVEARHEMVRSGWHQPYGRMLECAAYLALARGRTVEAAALAGGASVRFQSPRWLVELPLESAMTAAAPDAPGWAAGTARGATLDDGALAELVAALAG